MQRLRSPWPQHLLFLLSIYVALLLATPFFVPSDLFDWLFSEEGPFERVSMWLWLGLGVFMLMLIRHWTLGTMAGAGLCIAFAAREADLHKTFTVESMLRFDYYIETSQPIPARIIAGVIALAAVACVAIVCWCVMRQFIRRRGLQESWGRAAVLAGAVFVAAKVCDRFPGMLEEMLGIALPGRAKDVLKSCEEGLECATPLLFATVVWYFAATSLAMRKPAQPAGHAAPGDLHGDESISETPLESS